MKKNAVFSQKESAQGVVVLGVVLSYGQVPPTHPLLDRGMVLEAPACCRVFCFVFRKQISEPRSSLARGCGSSRQRGRKLGQGDGGWREGLWASPVCPRGRCRLQAPQALDLEGGDFQDRRTQPCWKVFDDSSGLQ